MTALIIFVAFILFLPSQVSFAQGLPKQTIQLSARQTDEKPTNCEYRIAVLDGITQSVKHDELIVVISRLGSGDTKVNLDWRRLENFRAYWTQFLSEGYRRKRGTIILAKGERIRGFGQLEFYASGKLIEVMKIDRNADLYIGECYPPDENYIKEGIFDPCTVISNKIFYPCRNRRVGKR